MKYKKSMIMLVLAILLVFIATANASDVNDASLTSEDANQIELSTNNEITEDNLNANEENTQLQSYYDETMGVENELDILSENEGTYTDLKNEIGNGGDINLTKTYYHYNSISDASITTIEITTSGVIDGKGAIIDMEGSTIQALMVTASGVTIKNLTIKNANYDGDNGGAIYSRESCTVSDCNFVNNSAKHSGAIHFVTASDVINCNFINNTALERGGAVGFFQGGAVSNCNFTHNTANDGGAVYFYGGSCTVSDCNFVNNSAKYGGAVDFSANVVVSNCNFVNNKATTYGGAVYFDRECTVLNCNFVNNKVTGSNSVGGAVYFDSKSTVSNCNFVNNSASNWAGAVYFDYIGEVTNCNFTNNHANYYGAIRFYAGSVINSNFVNNSAREGGAVYFRDNSEVTNCNFVNNSARDGGGAVYFSSNGEVTNCNFTDNTANRSGGGAVYFSSNGEVTNCNFVNNSAPSGGAVYFSSNGEVINSNFTDNSAIQHGGAVFMILGNVINCNFTDNFAGYGGAVYFYDTSKAINCNFNNNSASDWGGALCFDSIGNVTDCNFIDNNANNGGAVYFDGESTVVNSNFTGNNATIGSAIYFSTTSSTKTVSNSCFLKNRANADELQVTKNDNNITIIFTGNDNLLNAIYSNGDVSFTNVTYWGANGIANTGSSATIPSRSNREAGQNITVAVVVDGEIILNEVKVTDENGMITLPKINGENYCISVRHKTDSYYTEAEKTISNMVFIVNVTSQETHNRTVNITAKSNIFAEVMNGKLLFIIPNTNPITANYAGNGTWWIEYTFAEYGDYQVNATCIGLDNVTINNATISISKTPTNINIVNETVNLFVRDSISIGATLTPADAGNLTFTSNNESVAKVADGKIIAVSDGTVVITVSFAGNDDYEAAENKTITVKVIKYDSKVIISSITDVVYPNNVTIKYSIENKTNITVSIDGVSSDKIIITNDTITVIGLDAGTYTVTILNNENDLYYKSNDTKSFIVNKDTTSIDAADVSTIYNINKDLVVTLKDSNGQVLSGFKVTVDINGAKTYTTDKNGQIKVTTKRLAPKTYTAKITFNGNTNYDNSSKNVKVTVKKATPKITAKKKTYKATTKTKKYSVILKDNTGKAIKKAKLILKVKGKTYKATTNSKGKATFKIKKLNKKGTFKATITYKGNKYYKKVIKKSKIKVIITFKTVSRGSKDKSTVKEIQQALKDNGYYLSYKGHYLKVDGKYLSCTVRSVKEFQHDKGLKVTGKVDEKTAKKLGII